MRLLTMFAAIYIPDFPVEAIVRLKPELRERAVAVMEGTAPLLRVVAVNDRAADAGLEIAMTKLQAEEHASACNGVLAMRSPEQEASLQAALLDVACAFSPRVEDTAPGVVVLDLEGLERIFGPVAKIARDLAQRCSAIGVEPHVAAATNPDCAIHAARGFSGVTIIPEGREAERLATLPVEVLTVTALEISPLTKQSSQRTIRPRSYREMNSPLSSDSAVVSPSELLNTLESWGVRNLRALAALPEVAVTERLGQAGLLWQRMARGASQRTLRLVEPPTRFEETCELEYPVDSLEPLSFLLNRMLEQLCARLAARALATNELRVSLGLDLVEDLKSTNVKTAISDSRFPISDSKTGSPENQKSEIENQKWFCRSLRLPVPMLDAKVFLKLLQLDLQSHPPGAPVVKMSIEATPAEPRRTQHGLFQPSAPEPERLEVTLARIQSTVAGRQSPDDIDQRSGISHQQGSSEMRVGVAEILDTHRPDAFRMNRFLATASPNQKSTIENQKCISALRLFRPPVDAQVHLRAGKPVRLESEAVTGEIPWAAGPWKFSGDWWSDKPWSREEWDVCVGEACYRICREAKGWFVEGTYD